MKQEREQVQGSLFVSISNPNEILWEGEANAVSSENSQGAFDILPGHANFITIIERKPLIVHRISEEKTFSLKSAVVYVRSNTVTVYANI